MPDISNLKINERELTIVTTIENDIYIKRQYENRPNFRMVCGISNGRPIPKFAFFFNFDNFLN